MLSKEQLIQEDDYLFPYHYIAELTANNIQLSKRWGWAVNYLGRIEILLSSLKKKTFSNFCDIGCGDGRLISLLAPKYPDKKFLGIDYSSRAIGLATALNRAPNAEFRYHDLLKEKTATQFDGISLIEVLEHIPPSHLSDFVAKAAAILKPSGFAIITVPSNNMPLVKKHFQHFDLKKIQTVVEDAGLKVEDARYIDGSDLLFRIMRKIIYNDKIAIESAFFNRAFFDYYQKNLLQNHPKGNGVYLLCTNP